MARLTFKNGKWIDKETGEEVENKSYDWSAPPIIAASPYKPYNCPITGKVIDGKTAHKENLKKHGCRIMESGEREAFIKDKDRRETREIESLVSKMEKTMYERLS